MRIEETKAQPDASAQTQEDKLQDTGAIYTHIALSLARGYTDLYYVNIDTDEFIEFRTDDVRGALTEARKGSDFFEGCERDAKLYVHPEDQAKFIEAMDRQFLTDALEQSDVFEMTYRRIKAGAPFYVRMIVSRMKDDSRFVVIAVKDVDEQIRQRQTEERMKESHLIYSRINALSGNFVCVYAVDPETGNYREFGATDDYEMKFAQAKEGSDFFTTLRQSARTFSYPEDRDRVLSLLTQENVMAEIAQNGFFALGYRIVVDGTPRHFQLRAAMVEEKDGTRLIVGLNDVDAQVRQQEEYGRRLAQAKTEANIDALTGIKNKHAYIEVEEQINQKIEAHVQQPFAVVILDVNDLKKVNDTSGHQAGDRHLRDACKIICDTFKHSPVFRIGGDEFAVISQGDDYGRIDELLAKVNAHNMDAFASSGIVIACGMSRFDDDSCVAAVFERADQDMYENKKTLKAAQSSIVEKRYIFTAEKRTALEGLRQPFAVYQFINNRVVTLLLSDGFCDLFGYVDRAEAVYDMDNDMYKDTHPDDVGRISNDAIRFAMEGGTYDVVYRTRNVDGPGYVVVHAVGEHVRTDDGRRLAHVWYTKEGVYEAGAQEGGFDIAKSLSNALREHDGMVIDSYDYLTGLPSMNYFFALAEVEKRSILEMGGRPVVLYINFDGMKFFNTKNGFEQGDRLLRSFAWQLAGEFGNNHCCRIGADHFAVITEESGLEETLNDIFRDFEKLYDGKTPPVHVGIYPFYVEDVRINTACDRAKFVCNTLGGSYSSGFGYYDSELREDAMLKQYVVENLDTAIQEQWIQVYLQPIIRAVNENVCDVEALARWVDPEKGVLPPASFIPALEESGLVYKLDLYMVEQVLESIKAQLANGFHATPHSVNLSRADFDACDIVEEIRARVDAAGVKRELITIEITESVIGSDLEFMREQVKRFQDLGFSVWMDDFGSGYSSLDALQSIKFDLIKFDMSFMRKFDDDEGAKVVLTELMRMMTSLGVETVCEGVETEPQVRFLQEIGCTMLQGFYYSEPVPFKAIVRLRETEEIIKHENPEESEYYESIGRVNLYDLDVIAQDDHSSIQNTFDTLPMGIIEVRGDSTRFVRSNKTYRDFIKRYFGFELSELGSEFSKYDAAFMDNVVRTCCEKGLRSFYDEKMSDGSIVHSFARRIGINPVTGGVAVAVAVLSISESDETTSYADIARALAADYYNLYVIDLDADSYVEYSSLVGDEKLALERHGTGFFESAKLDAETRIYEGDRALFLSRFSKENVIRELDEHGVFTITYRLVDTGEPVYVNMKVTRLLGGNRLILGVSDIDSQMKQREEEESLRQERVALGRVAALSNNYIVLYAIDPMTGHYVLYNPSNEYEKLDLATRGEDFFADVVLDAPKAIYAEDMERHLRVLTKENMLREIKESGYFIHNYRLLIDNEPVPVSLKATLVKEEDGEKIILGVSFAS